MFDELKKLKWESEALFDCSFYEFEKYYYKIENEGMDEKQLVNKLKIFLENPETVWPEEYLEDSKKIQYHSVSIVPLNHTLNLNFSFKFLGGRGTVYDILSRKVHIKHSRIYGENYIERLFQYNSAAKLILEYYLNQNLIAIENLNVFEALVDENINIFEYRINKDETVNNFVNDLKNKEKSYRKCLNPKNKRSLKETKTAKDNLKNASKNFQNKCMELFNEHLSVLIKLLAEYGPWEQQEKKEEKNFLSNLSKELQFTADMVAWEEAYGSAQKKEITTTMYYLPFSDRKWIQVIMEIPRKEITPNQQKEIEGIFTKEPPEFFQHDWWEHKLPDKRQDSLRRWLLRRHFSENFEGKRCVDTEEMQLRMAARPSSLKSMPGLANWYTQKRVLVRINSELEFELMHVYRQEHSASHSPNEFYGEENIKIREGIAAENLKQSKLSIGKNQINFLEKPTLLLLNIAPKTEKLPQIIKKHFGRKDENMMLYDVSNALKKNKEELSNFSLVCHSTNEFRKTGEHPSMASIAMDCFYERGKIFKYLHAWLKVKLNNSVQTHTDSISKLLLISELRNDISISNMLSGMRALLENVKLKADVTLKPVIIVLSALVFLLEQDVFSEKQKKDKDFNDFNINLLLSTAEEIIYVYTNLRITRTCMSGCDRTQIGMAFTSAVIAGYEMERPDKIPAFFIVDLFSYHSQKTVSKSSPGRWGLKSFEGHVKGNFSKLGVVPEKICKLMERIDPIFMPFNNRTSQLNNYVSEKFKKLNISSFNIKILNLLEKKKNKLKKMKQYSVQNKTKKVYLEDEEFVFFKKNNSVFEKEKLIPKNNSIINTFIVNQTNQSIYLKLKEHFSLNKIDNYDLQSEERTITEICSYFDNQIIFDSKRWAVSYVHYNGSKNDDHGYIFLEGLCEGRICFMRAELRQKHNDTKKCYIQVELQTPNEKESESCFNNLTRKNTYKCESISWQITIDKALQLLNSIQSDKNKSEKKPYDYSLFGGNSISNVSRKIKGMNCVEWATTKLRDLHIPEISLFFEEKLPKGNIIMHHRECFKN